MGTGFDSCFRTTTKRKTRALGLRMFERRRRDRKGHWLDDLWTTTERKQCALSSITVFDDNEEKDTGIGLEDV